MATFNNPYHMPSTGAPDVTIPFLVTAWTSSANGITRNMGYANQLATGTAMTTITQSGNVDTTENHTYALVQYVTGPLATQTIPASSLITFNFRAANGSSSSNMGLCGNVRLMSNDGTTLIKQIVAQGLVTGATVFVNGTLTSFDGTMSTGLSAISITQGERLVIELGIQSASGKTTSGYNASFRIGDSGAADFNGTTVGSTTDDNGVFFLATTTTALQNNFQPPNNSPPTVLSTTTNSYQTEHLVTDTVTSTTSSTMNRGFKLGVIDGLVATCSTVATNAMYAARYLTLAAIHLVHAIPSILATRLQTYTVTSNTSSSILQKASRFLTETITSTTTAVNATFTSHFKTLTASSTTVATIVFTAAHILGLIAHSAVAALMTEQTSRHLTLTDTVVTATDMIIDSISNRVHAVSTVCSTMATITFVVSFYEAFSQFSGIVKRISYSIVHAITLKNTDGKG
jgi:hypothetical protein